MADFMSQYFGPLDKSSCLYFLIVTVIFFVALVSVLITEILYMIKNYNKLNFRMVSGGILILFNIFLAYFVNRLMYSMCVKSLA
jgi:hypothetical protein